MGPWMPQSFDHFCTRRRWWPYLRRIGTAFCPRVPAPEQDLVGPKLSNKKFTRSPKGPLAGEDDAEARNEPEQTDKRVGGNDEGEAGPDADKAEVCNAPEQTDKRVGGFDEDEAGPDADQAEIGGDAHEEEDSVESVEVDADGLGPARPHEGRQKGIAEGGPANLEASDGT
ncbi:unnamed protein product, partial [Effrenium voratum]